ncbi:MAG: class I SAM-dependent methyltransferase [Vicinamibacterales bacterium]
MAGLEDWLSVARTADPDELRERILTGFKEGKPFTPYVPTITIPAPLDRVLDFGCGVGRSFPYLKSIARHVTGFDLPPMIERCRTLAGESIDALSADWNDVCTQRFGLINAALVLQHIEPSPCRAYLRDFARMSRFVYLLSRDQDDFGWNVFEHVAQTGLFEAGDCIEVEHDPATHQLRVIRRITFDDARRRADGKHYEVLLRSRAAPDDLQLTSR